MGLGEIHSQAPVPACDREVEVVRCGPADQRVQVGPLVPRSRGAQGRECGVGRDGRVGPRPDGERLPRGQLAPAGQPRRLDMGSGPSQVVRDGGRGSVAAFLEPVGDPEVQPFPGPSGRRVEQHVANLRVRERDLAVAIEEDARFHTLLEQAVDVGHREVGRHREVTHVVGLAEQRSRREQRAALGGHSLDAGRHRAVEGAEVDGQVLVRWHEAAGLDAEGLHVETAAQDLLGEQRVASGGFDDQLDQRCRRGRWRDESEQLPQLGTREALQREGDGAGLALETSDGAGDAFVIDRVRTARTVSTRM